MLSGTVLPNPLNTGRSQVFLWLSLPLAVNFHECRQVSCHVLNMRLTSRHVDLYRLLRYELHLSVGADWRGTPGNFAGVTMEQTPGSGCISYRTINPDCCSSFCRSLRPRVSCRILSIWTGVREMFRPNVFRGRWYLYNAATKMSLTSSLLLMTSTLPSRKSGQPTLRISVHQKFQM